MCRMRFKSREKKNSCRENNKRTERKRKMSWVATQSNITGSHPKAWAKTFIYGTFWTSIMRLVHIQPSMFETKQQNDNDDGMKKKQQQRITYQIVYSHSLNPQSVCTHITPCGATWTGCIFIVFFPYFFSTIVCLQLLCLQLTYTFVMPDIYRYGSISAGILLTNASKFILLFIFYGIEFTILCQNFSLPLIKFCIRPAQPSLVLAAQI